MTLDNLIKFATQVTHSQVTVEQPRNNVVIIQTTAKCLTSIMISRLVTCCGALPNYYLRLSYGHIELELHLPRRNRIKTPNEEKHFRETVKRFGMTPDEIQKRIRTCTEEVYGKTVEQILQEADDVEFPDFKNELPEIDFELPEIDFEIPEIQFEIPEIQFEIPEIPELNEALTRDHARERNARETKRKKK